MSLRCKLGQLPRINNTGSTASGFRKALPGEAAWCSVHSAPCKDLAEQYETREVHGDSTQLRPRRYSASGGKRHHSCSLFSRKTSSPIVEVEPDRRDSRTWHPRKLRMGSKGIGSITAAAEQIRANLFSYADSHSCRTVGDVCWRLDGSPSEICPTLRQQSQDLAQRWMYPSNSLDTCVAQDLAELLSEIKQPGQPENAPGTGELAHLSDTPMAAEGMKSNYFDRSTPATTVPEDHGLETSSVCTIEEPSDVSELDARELWKQRRAIRRQRRQQAAQVTYGATLRWEHEQFISQQAERINGCTLPECTKVACA